MSSKPRFAFLRRARFKLTLYYTAIQLLCVVALCAFLYYRTNRSMIKGLEKFLKDETRDLMAYVMSHLDDWPAIQSRIRRVGAGERFYELSFRILDRDGKVLADSPVFREQPLTPVRPELLRVALDKDTITEEIQLPRLPSRHFLMTRPSEDVTTRKTRYIIQALAYLEPIDALSEHFRHVIYSLLPAFVLISWTSGYALARKVLRPIHLVTRSAREITSTNLNQRLLRSHSGDEFDMLAATLNEMIQRLEESFALLRQFAADAAHELRTPLTIMKGEAEVALRSNTRDPQAYRATLRSNIRECDHMISVITNLLFLAQADTGDVPLRRTHVRLDQLLAGLSETFQVFAEVGRLTFEVAPLPEVVVYGDSTRLHELFANLLDNAVKYTPAGGRVSVSCSAGPAEARISVSDTGVGIPEAEHEKIFQRFYRVDHSRSRETGGCGIGLSIARWIAKAHGGSIEVHSAPGAGSTFTVTLPLAPAPPVAPGAEEAAPLSQAPAPELREAGPGD